MPGPDLLDPVSDDTPPGGSDSSESESPMLHRLREASEHGGNGWQPDSTEP